MDLATDIGVGGARAGISAGHTAIADGGEEHGDHGDEDGGDHVAMGDLADDPEGRHRSGRLNEDDAVEDQVPETRARLRRGAEGGEGLGVAAVDMEDRLLHMAGRFSMGSVNEFGWV